MRKRNGHKNIIFIIALFFIFFGCFKPSQGFKAHYVNSITQEILKRHVNQNKFTDQISERTLENLIKLVDPFKLYFVKSDIEEFQKHKTKLDDYNKESNYTFIADFFTVYKKRYDERMKLFSKLIQNDFDFTIDESMVIDREKIDFAATDAEINERWRKRIKFQLLNYLNAEMKLKEAKKKVKKYYSLNKQEIEKYDEKRIASIYLNAFAMALDPHSSYMTAESYEDFLISMNLKLEGIGAVLRSEDGFVYVDSVIPGGPVSKMDPDVAVKPNDKIIAVAQGNKDPEDVIDVPLRDAVKLIRGKKGTIVKLTVLRKDDESGKEKTLIIPIVRDRVILEQQAAKYKVHEYDKGEKKRKIGYIRLPSFYMDYAAYRKGDPNAKMCAHDVADSLREFKSKEVDVVVFDLRGNPGGALHQAIQIAGFFIPKGPILMVKDHDRVSVHYDTDRDDYYIHYDGSIVVLVDSSSASASEIFAGAIRDYKRGLIIGPTRTFGKGSVQDLNPLVGVGGAVKVTIQLFYQPSGASNNKDGIYPHITVPSISQLSEYYESELDYPLDWKPIPSAQYTSFGDRYISQKAINKLMKSSEKRVAENEEFQKLIKKIEESKAKDNKLVSLKKETITKASKDDKKKSTDNSDKDLVFDLKNDIFLQEVFNITDDYIELYAK